MEAQSGLFDGYIKYFLNNQVYYNICVCLPPNSEISEVIYIFIHDSHYYSQCMTQKYLRFEEWINKV